MKTTKAVNGASLSLEEALLVRSLIKREMRALKKAQPQIREGSQHAQAGSGNEENDKLRDLTIRMFDQMYRGT